MTFVVTVKALLYLLFVFFVTPLWGNVQTLINWMCSQIFISQNVKLKHLMLLK
ncbi:hypothetical protein VCSRO52_2798 [Vibrio cholerae]|nr:hypothetical protein VCSRO52_2798 [Vibrio cholerae]